jgi:phospholipid/cholesterol/gamma-HCH transport system substrate-binding protein
MQVLNSVAAEVKDISDTSLKPLLKTFRKQIDAIGSDLARRIPEITANANKLLGSLNQGASSLNSILGKKNRGNIAATLSNFHKVSTQMLKATSQIDVIRKRLDRLLKNANHLVKDNRPDLRRSIIALRNTMESVSNNINVIVYNLEKASRNINEFSRQLRDNPGVLLSGKPPKDKEAAK